jgi:hypothetical protein
MPAVSLVTLAALVGLFGGCAAITNPVANGVPVNCLPPELLGGPSRDALQTLPLTALKQKQPEVYRLAPNDTLGVYIEGILPGTATKDVLSNPPIYYPSQLDPLARGLPASLGYPIPVRENGTLSLPLIDPVMVQGRSVAEAEAAIREAYVGKGILQAGRERIIVTLMEPRITRVTVVRQESGGFTEGLGGIVATTTKFGTGHIANLRAYENDVLTALTVTGGLPGLDAYTDIYVFKHAGGNQALIQTLSALPPGRDPPQMSDTCSKVIRIPTRILPCQPLPFRPEDILLENGDVVFVEERAQDLFYTAGLLPPGEHVLPRDYDLDVVAAIAKVQGSLVNGAFATSNLSGVLIQPGLGNPSPSLLSVIRRTANGNQVNIRVDLNKALRDRRERIIVQPGDMLILQETPGEAIARYCTQIFKFSIVSEVIKTSRTTGTTAAAVP